MLFAEVNLWLIGLSRTSLTILRLRRGRDPPRDLERKYALEDHVPLPMCTGGVVVIWYEESMEVI